LWKKYNEIVLDGDEDGEELDEDELDDMKRGIRQSHKKVLKELLKFFDWLVDLKPQPTHDIQTLYNHSQKIERSIADALSRATQLENKKEALRKLAGRNVKKFVKRKVWVQSPTERHNVLCQRPGCYSNCCENYSLPFSFDPAILLQCPAIGNDGQCKKCGHSHLDHRHYRSMWKQEERIVDEAGEEREKLKRAIARLDDDLKKSLDEVAFHSAAYSELSLVGSFTAPFQRTVRQLETIAQAMHNNNPHKDSFEVAKAKLELLTNATGSA